MERIRKAFLIQPTAYSSKCRFRKAEFLQYYISYLKRLQQHAPLLMHGCEYMPLNPFHSRLLPTLDKISHVFIDLILAEAKVKTSQDLSCGAHRPVSASVAQKVLFYHEL